MMDCKTFQNKLFAHADGNLPDEALKEMEAHALSCSRCASLLAFHRHMELAIAIEKDERPGPFAGTRILQHLENRSPDPETTRVPLFRPAMAAIGLLLALTLGFFIGNHGNARIKQDPLPANDIEMLKETLSISHFMDEDLFMLSNQ